MGILREINRNIKIGFRSVFGFTGKVRVNQPIEVLIEDLESHLYKTPIGINLDSKVNKFYGGGFPDVNNSINDLLIEKSIEELRLERAKKTLANSVRTALGLRKSIDYDNAALEELVDLNKVKLQELQEWLKEYNFDDYSLVKITDDYQAITVSKDKLRLINRRIKIALNKIQKLTRNLKEHFKKNHSFHFKNLDDYHSSILINRFELIKV